MEREIGYHAINMCDIPLKVYDKEEKMQIGTIIEKERFVIIDSWTSSDNNYINSKVKFINDNGEFSYGYLYDVSYPKQVSRLSECSCRAFYVNYIGICHIFSLNEDLNIYDREGIFIRTLNAGDEIASFKCENHSKKQSLMEVNYIRCASTNNNEWIKVQGFIDTKININPFSTGVHGTFNDKNKVIG